MIFTDQEIYEAVKNNLDRFPDGYIIKIDKATKNELVENTTGLKH